MNADPAIDVSAETPAVGASSPSPTISPSSPPAGAEAVTVAAAAQVINEAPIADDSPTPEKRGRGRPRKTAGPVLNSVTPAPPRPAPAAAPQPSLVPPVNYEQMAQTAANMWFNVPQLIFGEEWAPEPSEVIPVKDAFKDYFVSEQLPRIPPSWGLALVLLTYTTKRVTRPTIKERIYRGFEWVRAKVKR